MNHVVADRSLLDAWLAQSPNRKLEYREESLKNRLISATLIVRNEHEVSIRATRKAKVGEDMNPVKANLIMRVVLSLGLT